MLSLTRHTANKWSNKMGFCAFYFHNYSTWLPGRAIGSQIKILLGNKRPIAISREGETSCWLKTIFHFKCHPHHHPTQTKGLHAFVTYARGCKDSCQFPSLKENSELLKRYKIGGFPLMWVPGGYWWGTFTYPPACRSLRRVLPCVTSFDP